MEGAAKANCKRGKCGLMKAHHLIHAANHFVHTPPLHQIGPRGWQSFPDPHSKRNDRSKVGHFIAGLNKAEEKRQKRHKDCRQVRGNG
jgi:hypothetical protein